MHATSTRRTRRRLLGHALAAGSALAAAPWIAHAQEASATRSTATPTAGNEPEALFAELDAFIARRMGELGVPGAAVGVIAGDREHAAGFGVTNVDHPLPVDTDTLFQIGSTTKTFTGTAIMRLVERGTLDLDAPVREYLPEFRVADPEVSAGVRLRHLLTHTAGWQDAGIVETGDGDDALARLVAGMADRHQVAPPGEHLSYSNDGLALAGRVVEAVTGQTYEAAISDLVLEPLGMEQASFFPEEFMTEAFAVGHATPPGDPEAPPFVAQPWGLPRAANPAGGLVSIAAQQLRYARFHLGEGTANGERLLSAEGMRRMRTPLGPGGTLPTQVSPIDAIGVTWQLRRRGGVDVVSHSGGTLGQMSRFDLVPERGFALAVLTNSQTGLRLHDEVAGLAFERFLGISSEERTVVDIDPARFGEFVGDYALPNGAQTIRVHQDGGGLAIEVNAAGEPLLSSPVRFLGEDLVETDYYWTQALGDFVRDDGGEVAWFRYFGRLVPRTA